MEAYRMIGASPSPYAMKLRAAMRYRRLPVTWEVRNESSSAETAHLKPNVIPILQYPDGTFRNDSTPLLFDLERRHPEERSILPEDPGLAFLAYLLEDMADEWGVKLMFHHRFTYDPRWVVSWLISERMPGQPKSITKPLVDALEERQVGRRALVGSTEANRPLLEQGYRRVLDVFARNLGDGLDFLFGTRPSLADFAWYGQLKQCASDPTAAGIMRERAPDLFAWLTRLDDASGLEGTWMVAEASLSPAVIELLRMAGDTYLPFLEANAAAIRAGQDEVTADLLGEPYRQGVFKYQAKCFEQLRRAFAELPAIARERISPALHQAGCLEYLERVAAGLTGH